MKQQFCEICEETDQPELPKNMLPIINNDNDNDNDNDNNNNNNNNNYV